MLSLSINMFKSRKIFITFVLLFLIFIYLLFLIFSSVSIQEKLGKYPWTTESNHHEKEKKIGM